MTIPPRLTVLSPMFHDVESFLVLRTAIVELLDEVAHHPDRAPLPSARFVVVDDSAGRDPAVSQLEVLDDVTVITPPFNLGHQRAIVYGLRSIADEVDAGDVVVTMDADGEDRPEDLPALIDALLEVSDDRWRVCAARRTHREESLSFKAMYVGFRLLFRALTGLEIRSGNYAAFRGLFVHNMLDHPYFDLCYSSALISLTPDIIMVPCPRGTRYAGQSRMSLEKLLAHGVRMLMPFADRIAIRSLAFFSITASLTVLILVTLVISNWIGGYEVPTWTGWLLGASILGSGLALVNFLVLYSGFAQSSALSLARIDPGRRRRDGAT